MLLLAAVVACAACGTLFGRDYEYEEELYLDVDGSASIYVNASIAALVALRGVALDPAPESSPEPERVRALFAAPGVDVGAPSFYRRRGRPFVRVRVTAPDLAGLHRVPPLAWSSYALRRNGGMLVFHQTVGKPAGTPSAAFHWNGNELVAFRLHAPSKILFENATSDVQRGNILAWEQRLAERREGTPLELHVEMESESILHTTLLLFASTIVAAGATFALAIWWVRKKGREIKSQIPNPKSPIPKVNPHV
jgi:hypothetical protein